MKVSVVIATCGRPRELARCLGALATHESAHGHDVDVTTVHAPGDDESISGVRDGFPDVGVLHSERRNVAHQRNVGMRAATGEVVVFLDDDAWPLPGWIDALAAAFAEDPSLAEVGGPVLNEDGSLQMGPTAISRFARTRPVEGPNHVPPGYVFQVTGCNMAFRADALRDVGGFDESYAYHLDDSDVALRLHDAGRRIGWAPDARVVHVRAAGPHRSTLWDRDWYSVAMNDVYFAFRHVRRARWRLCCVPWVLQLGRGARLCVWFLRGRLGPGAFVRCTWRLKVGVLAGYKKGLTA